MDTISIHGARTHNLKNINLDIPRGKLVVITGLSGSGKSSLAFDTLYAEGQRRYVESLSSYARQFLSMMDKPDVDHIEGLSPAIAIDQKSTSHNPRSTVGTITEIYDYLRVLFARIGEPRCPVHGTSLAAQSISQMVDTLMALPADTRLLILAPVVQGRKGEYKQLFSHLRSQGYIRARIDGKIEELDTISPLNAKQKHSIEVVVDRGIKVKAENQLRLSESLATAALLSEGLVTVVVQADSPKKKSEELVFSERFACSQCGYSISELEPRLFSFNNPAGACPQCDGIGHEQIFDEEKIVTPLLSLSRGAIQGWNAQNPYYFSLLKTLAKHYQFSLEQPFHKLAKKIQKIILYGSGEEELKFHYQAQKGYIYNKKKPFEGVIPMMKRRYQETESHMVREELARYLAVKPCTACGGSRLNNAARHVFIGDRSIAKWAALPIDQLKISFEQLTLSGQRAKIASGLKKEIVERLNFLIDVGLDYLALDRSSDTLSGGESQRIRLASQIGSGLVGVMYILDEPSIGLHQRDNARLLSTLLRLRDLGNTVIVVEHDEDAIRHADHVIDMGPGAGVHGGEVIAQGSPAAVMRNPKSLTGKYLSGQCRIVCAAKQRHKLDPTRLLKLTGATGNNLKDIDIEIPLGLMTCITGVSGSGKSTLINDTLYPLAARELNAATLLQPAPYRQITGLEQLDKIIDIDQSPIGRTPRSNPATYIGMFTSIRELFAATPEARSRGYTPGRFSFNVKGGRCESCEGDGVMKVEMHFLADIYVQCDICKGQRYNRETLEIRYKDKTIYQILEMTVEEACEFFKAIPALAKKLQTLIEVGLAYIHLGQSAPTLSGGEAQRVKLAKELSKRDTGRTLYILDEPTTGLHFYDIEQLLKVLHSLRDRGNTVVVIEHNLDVIKTADWVIDLGPEGGVRGGQIICVGTPEQVAKTPQSYTGQFLKPLLGKQTRLSAEKNGRHG
ncbi:MAG: excinuclease ABC subunit UvrA [Pseudomonadota bacterium]